MRTITLAPFVYLNELGYCVYASTIKNDSYNNCWLVFFVDFNFIHVWFNEKSNWNFEFEALRVLILDNINRMENERKKTSIALIKIDCVVICVTYKSTWQKRYGKFSANLPNKLPKKRVSFIILNEQHRICSRKKHHALQRCLYAYVCVCVPHNLFSIWSVPCRHWISVTE